MNLPINRVLIAVLADVAAETEELDRAVAGLSEEHWRTPTAAPGWDVATQISHLAWTDEAAYLAARAAGDSGEAAGWEALAAEVAQDPAVVDTQALAGAQGPPSELLARWRIGRANLSTILVNTQQKLPWFGPPMSATSMATARFMETWAHAQDVYDGLGLRVEPTDRIKHVCYLGVRTRDFAYGVHELPAPAAEFGVSLTAPSGEVWDWGPADAAQRVTGPAIDFARLVTQRVHRADTALLASGTEAEQWLGIAQAFAGPPGVGRAQSR